MKESWLERFLQIIGKGTLEKFLFFVWSSFTIIIVVALLITGDSSVLAFSVLAIVASFIGILMDFLFNNL